MKMSGGEISDVTVENEGCSAASFRQNTRKIQVSDG